MSKFTKNELLSLKKICDAVKTKDADIDIKHIADYLWTWERDSESIVRRMMHEEYRNAAKAGAKSAEEAAKIAYEKVKVEFTKVYRSLQVEVDKKLKNGYNIQLRMLEDLRNDYAKKS